MQEDTAVGRVYRNTAFTIQDDGTLIDRRTWAQGAPTPQCTKLAETLGQLQFGPDGCALDADEPHLGGRRSGSTLRALGRGRRDRRT